MRKADNVPPSCAVVTESGNLNFLEPSGPLRACNGTALPFLAVQGVYPIFIVNKCTACEGSHLTLYPRYKIYVGYICIEFENNYDCFNLIMS